MHTELRLIVNEEKGRTKIEDAYFTARVKIMEVSEEKRLKVLLMTASAGMLKDDFYDFHLQAKAGSKWEFTGQSYTKIFHSNGGQCGQRVQIRVEDGADFWYCPCSALPFEKSNFSGDVLVKLDKKASFLYTEVLGAGRVAMGERFAFERYRNRLLIQVEGVPVFLDYTDYEPARMNLENFMYFDGYTHQGCFYYYGSEEVQEFILEMELELEDGMLGVSRARQGVCIRALANGAQNIEALFQKVKEQIEQKG